MSPRFRAALFAALIGFVYMSGARADELPTLLKPFEAQLGDEAAFVDATRSVAKVGIAASAAEIEQAGALRKQGKNDEAQALVTTARARLAEVRGAYEWALSKYPNNAPLQNSYGELLYDQFNEHAGALKAWNLAISIDSNYAPAYSNIGLDECHRGAYESGVRNLERAIEIDPKNPDFLFNIVQIYMIHRPQVAKIKGWDAEKTYRNAMKYSKEAAKLAPNDFELVQDYAVNFFAAENFGIEADWAAAAKAWQAVRPLADTPNRLFFTWLNEARCWIKAKDAKRARPCLEEALKIRPESGPAKQMLEALPELQKGGKKKPRKD